MRFLFLGIALLFGGAAGVSAASYYVDYAAGSDAHDGTTPGSAWKHCPGDPMAGGGPAACTLAPGDTVYFKGGVTYLLRGERGIALNADGAAGAVITYDGNSRGSWGQGRARLSDDFGTNALHAFEAVAAREHLRFRGFEFAGIGGAAMLPFDVGAPLPARPGGGIAFKSRATGVEIEDCSFSELGFWFAEKPMAAASLRGTGVLFAGANGVRIANCDFRRVAIGCDFTAAKDFSGVTIESCRFEQGILWPLRLPPGAWTEGPDAISVRGSPTSDTSTLSSWNGYGHDPRTEVANVASGASVTLSAAALASPTAFFQWRKDGKPLAGATSEALRLAGVTVADAGTYTVVASNGGGATTSNPAVIVVDGVAGAEPLPTAPPAVGETGGVALPPPPVPEPSAPVATAPVMTLQPVSYYAAEATPATLSSGAAGTPAPTFQWFRNGSAVPGATSATLAISAVTAADDGTYVLVATNSAGSVSSSPARLTVLTAPRFTQQPVTQMVAAESMVVLSAAASSTPAPTYQWSKDGIPVPGATSGQLSIARARPADSGLYFVTATNPFGSATSNSASVTVFDRAPAFEPTPALELPVINVPAASGPFISSRETLMITDQPVTTQFVVGGNASRWVVLRAVGPSLSALGLNSGVADPILEIFSGNAWIAGNDNWGGDGTLAASFSLAGAFPLVSAGSRDAALYVVLQPGVYRAVISGGGGSRGVVLLEVFQLP